ncbi:hypothetical protein [Mucilaginibacter sp. UYCu711]|uniref:hypothetical protein n=1 Tax=Mucilaginibacter sp. UYCu711 TaxID=3156339 RepID=UPI003D220BFB
MKTDNVKTFSKTFDIMKGICILAIVTLFLSNAGWLWAYVRLNKEVGKKVFVVTDSGTIWATEKDNDNTFNQYESRNFVKVFCNLMFAHDATTYNQHLNAALPLIHRDFGSAIKADYDNNHLYQQYVNYDASNTVQIDSIVVLQDTRPQRGAVFMRLITHYGDKSISNPLAYKFTLDRVQRSDLNPYGLFITSLSRIVYNPADVKQDENQLLEKQAADKKVIDSLVQTPK